MPEAARLTLAVLLVAALAAGALAPPPRPRRRFDAALMMLSAGAFYLLGQVDFIIAADHATFVDPHVTYSMPAVYEPIEALAKMPFGEAMRVALLGASERMSARRAYEVGFVSEVVPLEELMDAATWAAEAIAAQPPAAIMATLRTLWAAREMFPAQATALGNTFLHLGMDTDKENLKEGEETFASRPRTKPRIR